MALENKVVEIKDTKADPEFDWTKGTWQNAKTRRRIEAR
jgi:hypothetical protein